MSITYPVSLDSLPNPTSTDLMENATLALDHDQQHSNANDAIEALEAKVGIDSSAVNTSHDFKLSGVATGDKAVSKTGTETLTNKTLTSPIVNVTSDATGDIYYRNSGGLFTRLAAGATDTVLSIIGGLPTWVANPSAANSSYTVKGIVQFLTDAATSGITVASGVINVNTGTGANQIVKRDSSGNYPSGDGSAITNISLLKTVTSTSFETAARFTSTLTAITDQANNFSTYGLRMQKGTTYGAGYNSVTFQVTGKASTLYLGSPIFSARINLTNTSNSVFSSFFGLGNPTAASTGHTYTVGHAGFKVVKAGGVISLYATQADGATETASSALTTLVSGDDVDLIVKINSTTSVDYYYRVNGGSLSAATNLTANMPAGTSQTVQASMSSNNVDDGVLQIAVTGATYTR